MAVSARVGYVRVSTIDQKTDRQLVGIELDKVFEEKASGKSTARPVLREMLNYLREGDHLFVHSMDRLARNLVDLLKLVNDLTTRGVTVHFVKEHLDFGPDEKAAPMSKLLLSVMGAVAEFERALILERQREGIALAKAKGLYKGRRPTSITKLKEAVRLIKEEGLSQTEAVKRAGTSRTTLFRYLKNGGDASGKKA